MDTRVLGIEDIKEIVRLKLEEYDSLDSKPINRDGYGIILSGFLRTHLGETFNMFGTFDNGVLVGIIGSYIIKRPNETVCEICSMYTTSKYRNFGIQTDLLIPKVLDESKKDGVIIIESQFGSLNQVEDVLRSNLNLECATNRYKKNLHHYKQVEIPSEYDALVEDFSSLTMMVTLLGTNGCELANAIINIETGLPTVKRLDGIRALVRPNLTIESVNSPKRTYYIKLLMSSVFNHLATSSIESIIIDGSSLSTEIMDDLDLEKVDNMYHGYEMSYKLSSGRNK